MNISYKWLKDYLDTDKSPTELSEILTDLGLEIGSVEVVESVKGGLKGIVVGEVLTCAKHPDADKLSVTTVDIGGEEPLPIVCGAPNVAAGQKVVVATVGTTLYSGDESFKIKKAKIRGEVSEGMICAEDEIGLGTSHDGIMVLDPDTKIGTLASEYFNIESDTIFEVELTPNRIDGASHIGVARDLVAAFRAQNIESSVKWPSVEKFKVDNNNYPIKVSVENSEAAPRYSGLTMTNITVKESPDWLKNRLLSIGMTPINNVVDITNFVLHETGQPLHAFDGDKIKGNHVRVRTMPTGTKFTTLDEKELELTESDLMICDETDGMCIAGVFGGIDSGVTENTTKIFLESACFDSVYVRKTSRHHALFTDASFRFERGSDPNMTIYALKRAALLIKELAGGEVSSDIIDIYPNPVKDFSVTLNYSNMDRLIGKVLDRNLVKIILTSLDIKIDKESSEELQLSVPPYRVDVQREADVIEEILRVYGYNNVEDPTKVNSTVVYADKPDRNKIRNILADQLSSVGFVEIMNNSLTKASYYEDLTTYPADKTVILANPLSNDLNGMRQTLLFGGLESIERNINRRHSNLKLVEFGNCYSIHPKADKTVQNSYQEEEFISLFVTGLKAPANWNTPEQKVTFSDIKTYTENILSRLGFNIKNIQSSATKNNDIYQDGLDYRLGKNQLATIGWIKNSILKEFDIEQTVFYAELNFTKILQLVSKKDVVFSELSKYPEVHRDLALLIDKSVKFEEIEKVAFKTEKAILKSVSLFDVYEGKNLGENKKSYAVSFVLEDKEKTLKDKQIDKTMNRLIEAFKKEIGAELRG